MINYELLPEFEKDFKALLKRFQTLDSDFERFKKFSIEPHFGQNIETTSFVKIEGNCGEKYSSYKVRKFACRALMQASRWAKRTAQRLKMVLFIQKKINLSKKRSPIRS